MKDLFLLLLGDKRGLPKEFLLLRVLQAERKRSIQRKVMNPNVKRREEKLEDDKRDNEKNSMMPREQLPRLDAGVGRGSARQSTCGVGWDRRGDAMAFG